MNRGNVQETVDQLYPEYRGQLVVDGSEEEWDERPSLYFCGDWFPKHQLLTAPTHAALADLIHSSALSGEFEKRLLDLWDEDITEHCLRLIKQTKELTNGCSR